MAAAPDFSAYSQNLAMSTSAGAPNANISPPWCAASPPYRPQQAWQQDLERTRPEQAFAPLLPLPTQFHGDSYGLAQNQHPRSPYGSHASYDRQHPQMMSYPEWTFGYVSNGPRLPPSIRSGLVGGLPAPAHSNMYHGGNPNYESYHMWPQGRPPITSGLCPARRPPQSAAMSANTTNLSYVRGQHGAGFGGSSGGGQQSQQSNQSHPRLPMPTQGPQMQQPAQLQPTRTGVIQYNGQEEGRSSRDTTAQSRRSDRSSSPRAANRRSFDAYAEDRSTSSTSSDAEEAAARSPPGYRLRQAQTARERRMRFYSADPATMLDRQIKKLKEILERYTLNELPEVTSPTCDICAKDYSAKNVQPSEDEEIAIMLPCGHVFGEFCIDHWFETCKTHNNKITCPMCRKQLVEPPSSPWRASPGQWMASPSELRRAFPDGASVPSYLYSSQYARV